MKRTSDFSSRLGKRKLKKPIVICQRNQNCVNSGSPLKIQNLTVNDLPADSPLASVIVNERLILSTAEKSEVSFERSEVNEVLKLTPIDKITFTGAGEYLSVEEFLQLSENEVEEQIVYGEMKRMLSGNLIYDEFGKAIPITFWEDHIDKVRQKVRQKVAEGCNWLQIIDIRCKQFGGQIYLTSTQRSVIDVMKDHPDMVPPMADTSKENNHTIENLEVDRIKLIHGYKKYKICQSRNKIH